jgi:type IV secretory pathway TrbL component
MRRACTVVLAVFMAVALVYLPGLARTGPGQWSGYAEGASSAGQGGDAVGTRLHDGAKDFGESLLGGIKFVGRTIASPFTGTTGKVNRDADATGKQLHRGAKGFGEGLLGGAKYAGRKVGDFFSDSHDKGSR